MSLTVIAGPMFAGKSERVLTMLDAAKANGLKVIVVKPQLDTRHPGLIWSRNGQSAQAQELPTDGLFDIPHGIDLLVIDEAHMFGRFLMYSIRAAMAQGTRVIVAGVDYNCKVKPFLTMSAAIHAADYLIRVYAACYKCSRTAAYTLRLVDSDQEILVGDAEYAPICFDCLAESPEAHMEVALPRRIHE